jgi:peptide/nickel transport system ATP-binding protein
MKYENNKQDRKLLEINNLKVHIKLDEGVLNAVDGVSFSLEKGKTLGLVGESGCGKSLTSKAIIGINPKNCITTGEILLNTGEEKKFVNILELKSDSKEIRAIRGGRISMIFQEPMTAFSPLYTIGNQIMENILIHRTGNKKEAEQIALETLERVGITM